jgi:imidazolonepropionase-like amidohydrolase
MEINADGLFVMPGMIDTHSHMAIQGGVNEATLSIVPEVRVADVIDGDDPAIYRALAGGTTAARLLHGSANTIGGQDAIIKLRPGHPGRDILLKDSKRPQGVKFALGENVTRRTNRFPTTRLGVEATIERAFQEGKAYADAQKAWEDARRKDPATAGPAPRRDLRLEALARIVSGDIKIHSHCYRADEILMLLRTAERHNVRVQSLQHVLEGYKVAAEIAAHGASASTFSDWWAYKIEAFDAVPANAAILAEAGANAVIKSDDAELVRHLNLEAAKSVKYGSMPEEKALALVTINAARELGLDHRMGSIEVGKDADLAIFDAHPLDTLSQVRLTLINGEIEFQRGKSLEEATKPKKLGELARNENASKKRVLDFKEDPDNRRTRAFVGGRVHPVDGPTINKGVVIIENDRIKTVGGPDTPIPNGAEVVNMEGLDIWPGLIDAGSRVGLTEVGSLRETQDYSDLATFQPELIAGTAINPDSEVIPVTRANGVLTVLAQPAGGVISGQASLVNLAGWIPSQMVLNDRVALQVQIPGYVPPRQSENGVTVRNAHECACEDMATGFADHAHEAMADDPSPEVENQRNEARQRRSQRLEEIADQFKQSIAYSKAREAAAKGEVASFKADPRMEAMLPYARGEKPVIFQANHRAEILDALFLAKALKLKAIIGGGQEAWKVAPELKEAGVPVLISGVLQLPGESHDPYDAPYTNAAKLQAAGVKFAIQSGGGGPDEATAARNLPFEAGTAAAFGLSEADALKSITLAPAEILGMADQLGSIKAGKKANLVVSRGSILQATTPVVLLVIDGRVMKPESRHTRLADKYRERLRQVRAGVVPLGVNGNK